jgi:hypothetical protein
MISSFIASCTPLATTSGSSSTLHLVHGAYRAATPPRPAAVPVTNTFWEGPRNYRKLQISIFF